MERSELNFARLDALEAQLCLPFNRMAQISFVRGYFATVSRLGDGVAWYAMLAVLPVVFGFTAWREVAHMGVTALVAVVIYKLLKEWLVRERPCLTHAGIAALAAPLDRYSFPSGHTMHAVAFVTMLGEYYPDVALLMLPFAVSIAVSRVVLGLHYPSDVAAGAILGWAIARSSLFAGGLLGI